MSDIDPGLDGLTVCCLSNDREILDLNLRASPVIASGRLQLDVEMDAPSATIGYNRLLERHPTDICILVHHDVYLPDGWDRLLMRRIAEVEAHDPDWAVIAASGIGPDGRHWGPVWSSAFSRVLGGVTVAPQPIQAADELLIVFRADTGLRFDEELPHFHFHGLDIVQTVLAAGKGAYNVPLPLIHNDRFAKMLGDDYRDGYRHMQRKWRDVLPLMSTTVKISWHGLHLRRALRRMKNYSAVGSERASRNDTPPQVYAERCCWSSVG